MKLLRLVLFIACLVGITFAPQSHAMAQGNGTHVVAPGETLFRIALQYGVSVNDLTIANGLVDPSRIYVGQVLMIPAFGSPVVVLSTDVQSGAPAAPAEPIPQAPPASGGYYTVQVGDTLAKIGARFGVSWTTIASANNLWNPNQIYVGQQLLIPGTSTQPPPAQPAPEPQQPPTTPATGGVTHVVKAGEGLAQIARTYGVAWSSIAMANNLSNPNLIYVGQVLVIPNGTSGAPSNPAPSAPSGSGKWVLVILSEQRMYIYENGSLLKSFLVSTGLPMTPTVQGNFKIYVKYAAQLMTGPGYYLPNVPYVMYFYQDYGLHGTYWHNNFGQPMSHGCVNMPTPEAEWLYNWAPVGTPVTVRW